MRISDHLIELVLSGGGTEEEKKLVMEFFNDNPGKLAQYLTEDSWEKFEAEARPEAPREKMLQTIENSVGKAPAPVRELGEGISVREMGKGISVREMSGGRRRYGWVAAAAVVLVVGLISLLYRKGDPAINNTKPAVAVAGLAEKKANLQVITNLSLKSQLYSLSDGSKVKLAGNSSISFNNPFIDNRRDIYLKGEAVFTVAKDGKRPFTVHSRGIMTTALGTVFRVDDRGGQFTTVHLYSGRVVVKKEVEEGKKDAAEGKAFAAVYLSPGEQLLLNNADFSVQIKRDEPKAAVAGVGASKRQPTVLRFTKQPLAEIFDLLQKQYAITISYETDGLKNMDFTGVFNSDKETLESFLGTLCDLNELTLKKTGTNRFSIQTK